MTDFDPPTSPPVQDQLFGETPQMENAPEFASATAEPIAPAPARRPPEPPEPIPVAEAVASPLFSPRQLAVPNADDIAPGASYGQYLRELRQAAGVSLTELADETKIKPLCLQALEEENLADLPQEVFVVAYVKKLCQLYGVGLARQEEITSELRGHLKKELPEDISRNLRGHYVSDDNERRIRRLAIGISAIAAVLLILLICGIALAVRYFLRDDRPTVLPVEFNEEQVLKLQPKAELRIVPLPEKKK